MGKSSDQDVISWLLTQTAAAAHMYTHTEYHYKHLYVIGAIIVKELVTSKQLTKRKHHGEKTLVNFGELIATCQYFTSIYACMHAVGAYIYMHAVGAYIYMHAVGAYIYMHAAHQAYRIVTEPASYSYYLFSYLLIYYEASNTGKLLNCLSQC